MKKLILVLMTFFFSMNVQASHIVGQSITVQYAGIPNTYFVKMVLYRDCAGILAPGVITVNYSNGQPPQTTSYQSQLSLVNQQVLPGLTCIPTTPILCSNGFGIESFEYSGTVVLPYASSSWYFWRVDCCRPVNLLVLGQGTGNFYCEAILDNLNYPTNSLPEFNQTSAPIFCLNQPAIFSNAATDLDGDSIVYSLIPAFDYISINTPAPYAYAATYSPTKFVASSTPVLYDPITSIASFTPNMIHNGLMVVRASEYRNGNLIGSSIRDLNLWVMNGSNSGNLLHGNVYIDLNNDSIKNGVDYGIKNVFVKSTPQYAYNVTDVNGDYGMQISTGPHVVDLGSLPPWFSVNPTQYNFNFTTAGNTNSGTDFSVYPIPGTTELELSMSVNPVRPLVKSSLMIRVKNNGSDITAGTLVLTLPDSVSYDAASIAPTSIVGSLVSWSMPNINLFESFDVKVWVIADSGLIMGDSVYFEANVTASPGSDVNPSNNVASGWVNVVNSFDPNIKTVFPNGTIPQSKIISGQPLTYRIEFENTGNANALTVRLTDKLPAEVKLNSIEILSASHAYTTQINYPRELEFTFSGINLPPTSVDPINSKGYIIFKVTPENNLSVGTVVANEAKIYFDNNPPVITPMAEVIVVGTTGTAESNNVSSNALFIYPNPTQDRVYIEMPGAESGKYAVSLYSVEGKLINAQSIQKQKEQPLQLDFSLTEKGIYIIIVSKGNHVWSSRVVRN